MCEDPRKASPSDKGWSVTNGDRGGGNFDVVSDKKVPPDSPAQQALGRMQERDNRPVVTRRVNKTRQHHDK